MIAEQPRTLVIAGPTASGKSQLALELGKKLQGSIINADSMQVYPLFPVLSAQPSAAEKAVLPHHLYSYVAPPAISTAASWKDDAEREITRTLNEKRLPMLVGGTGMYLEFLLHGVSSIPDVPDEFRQRAQSEYRANPATVRNILLQVDPEIAARLKPGDTQRTVRAYEVYLATGKPLSQLQKTEFVAPSHAWKRATILLLPERKALYRMIDGRFNKMLETGALDEVKRSAGITIPLDHPVLKTVGVPELNAYLLNELSLKHAIEKAQQASRNYAKRQVTWFRNRFLKKEVQANTPVLVLENEALDEKISRAEAFLAGLAQ